MKGRIRTDGFTVLQTVALGLSATLTLFGVPRGIRTPTSGFGDRHAAVNTRDILFGAGDQVRTDDIFLGKEVLYQLSYTRIYLVEVIGLEPITLSLQS